MSQLSPHDLVSAFSDLQFFAERLPDTPAEAMQKSFTQLSPYRNGAIYIGHYAGQSEWERHPQGDEIVMVIEGQTRLVLLQDDQEISHNLSPLQLMVVPAGIWHRFETPEAVKILTVTPQPSDHQLERPES